jgi:RNA polymerase primary sigma factor
MNFAERLQLLQSVKGDPALVTLLMIDLAYPDESAVERDALKQALLAAAIPHWCDPPFLASLLAVAPYEAERLHLRLCALTVVEPFPARGKRAANVHEATRLVLREHVRKTMPHLWRTLSIRARNYLEPATSVHSRIECLHHLFAIDQEEAAAECEALERNLFQNPEWKQALAVSLTEVAAIKGWLQGSALVQALLIPLQVRLSRGETTTLELEARALVALAETSDQASGLARAHCLLGDVYVSQGRFEIALSCYMETLEICGCLAEADPSNIGWQCDLATAHARMGDVYVYQGQIETALTSFQKTLTISQRLAEADLSNASWQRELAVAHSKTGDVYLKQGRHDAALTSFQKTLTINERLAETDSSNAGCLHEPRLVGVSKSSRRFNTDSIGWYLSTIGSVPLLTPAEEIELAHLVRKRKELLQLPPDTLTSHQKRQIRVGQRARDRMLAANLRLVVSVAKKYQNQGLELLDLVQEGAIGLERAVDKFDPGMGYKFSTYAYWWIRQGMTRAIDNSARTIRLPIHISEKLSKLRRITKELSHRLGRQPNRLEMAHGMGMEPEELEELITQTAPCASLDAHARGEEDRSTLGELIADPASNRHLDSMDRHLQKEHLVTWLAQLNEREQKILRLRFGLDGEEPLTLAEIGRQINMSRERVRQLEAKAIMKLRLLSDKRHAAI